MVGESLMKMSCDAFRSGDGSSIAIQTSKGSYNAGERIDGVVVLQNNSPRQVTRVLVRVSIKEHVMWDEEITRTHHDNSQPDSRNGHGDSNHHHNTHETYEHHTRVGKVRVKRE